MARSVARNALYSGIRTITSMLFPLITFPYATRVLLSDNLGKIDFSSSIISYFALIATLGIASYATREGARVREDRAQLDRFASQVFSINMVSTLVAYALLALLVVAWPHLHGYLSLIAVQSVTIIGTTLGVEWVYTLEEDYGYITARMIVVQAVSAVLLFALVRRPSDYVTYACISVFASVGANVFNFLRARRYVTLRLVWDMEPRRHLAPILILFGNAIAVTVYLNLDVTLLNVMRGDHEVGIYGAAVKVYQVVKSLLNSLTTVAVPRISLYLASGREDDYTALLASVAHGIVVGMAPILTMLFLMADYVVLIAAGPAFVEAVEPLRILCVAAVPAVFASYTTNAILLPNKGERKILLSTSVGAVVNFALNLVAIPRLGAAGAALTTLVAEVCVLAVSAWFARRHCDARGLARELAGPLCTALVTVVAMCVLYPLLQAVLGRSVVSFLVSGVALVACLAVVVVARRDAFALHLVGRVRELVGRDGASRR